MPIYRLQDNGELVIVDETDYESIDGLWMYDFVRRYRKATLIVCAIMVIVFICWLMMLPILIGNPSEEERAVCSMIFWGPIDHRLYLAIAADVLTAISMSLPLIGLIRYIRLVLRVGDYHLSGDLIDDT